MYDDLYDDGSLRTHIAGVTSINISAQGARIICTLFELKWSLHGNTKMIEIQN